jgi:phospholipid/cholesterol/gamma-HCH transport system substrate-binding protein
VRGHGVALGSQVLHDFFLLKDDALYIKLNQTCEAATALLEDLKKNPKRYVHFSVFGKKDKGEE